jgi:hypothetical protein
VSKASSQKTCPACHGETEFIFGAARAKPEETWTSERYDEIARRLAGLLHQTHNVGDEADMEIAKIEQYLSENGGTERMKKVLARVREVQVEPGEARLLELKWWG